MFGWAERMGKVVQGVMVKLRFFRQRVEPQMQKGEGQWATGKEPSV